MPEVADLPLDTVFRYDEIAFLEILKRAVIPVKHADGDGAHRHARPSWAYKCAALGSAPGESRPEKKEPEFEHQAQDNAESADLLRGFLALLRVVNGARRGASGCPRGHSGRSADHAAD